MISIDNQNHQSSVDLKIKRHKNKQGIENDIYISVR